VGLNSDIALGLMSDMLKLALLLSLPLLGVILIVGALISVLQVVTQVQDPSIAFVPKLVLFVVMLALLGPWMLQKLTGFGVEMFSRLAQ
jgi:flagellar biosynthetic protein FliQ